ncbi:hypothetical protein EYR40_002474 [Pleurotus pulmonarius]|nr:hypothetical protein EYR40_002474 [Pleurotus pulmonarius]
MRILANHGGDKRFAFLRGRWKLAWQVIKGRAKIEKSRDDGEQEAKPASQKPSGLGGLTGYGDSEDEDEGSGGEQANVTEPTEIPDGVTKDEEALKELRRQKAKEWAQKRREFKLS